MTPQELALILQAGEGYLIEFKESVNTDLAKEMVAMANASGGRIFIGVNDLGQIVGVRYSNSLAAQIQDMAQHCDPPVAIELEPYQNMVIVHVKEGLNKPRESCAVMIEIFDDRVVFTNPGGLPRGLSKAKFGQLSVPRNPLIAALLHRTHYIEKMGTGIHRMRESLRQAGHPAPDFDIDSFFTLTFQRPDDAAWRAASDEFPKKRSSESSPESSPEKKPFSTSSSLSKTQQQILALIQKQPSMTTEEMGNAIGISKRAILKQIKTLKEKQLIQRQGSTKKGHWQIIEEQT